MATSRFSGELAVGAATVGDEQMDATRPIGVTKQQHGYVKGTSFDLPIGGTPVTREEIVHVATGPGVLRGFHALLNADGSSTDIDFDLKVNGVSVLSAVVTITDSTGDGVVADGTLSSTALAEGDIVSIAMTVTSSTGAQGPFAWVSFSENEAPA